MDVQTSSSITMQPALSTPTRKSPAYNPISYCHYTKPQYPMTELTVAEDNEAVIKTIANCRGTALRRFHSTQHIDAIWLFAV